MNIKETCIKTGKFLFKNRARVLTAVGIGCNALAVYFAWKNAPKAIIKMEDERDRVNNEASIDCEADIFEERELTVKEKAKCTWREWVVPAALMLAGDICIVASDKIDVGEIAAALMTAKKGYETVQKFEEKAEEIVGKSKANQIHDAVAEEMSHENVISADRILDVGCTGAGVIEWYDPFTNAHFYANTEFVNNKVSEWDDLVRSDDGYGTSYADLLELMHLPIPKLGYFMGMDAYTLKKKYGESFHIKARPTSMFKEDGTTMAVFGLNIDMIPDRYN